MERLVVCAVGVDEPVDAVGVEVTHLRDEAGAADRGADKLLVRLRPEDGHGRVSHRGEDDRARVDQRAVQIEEHNPKAHASIVASRRGAPRLQRSGPQA